MTSTAVEKVPYCLNCSSPLTRQNIGDQTRWACAQRDCDFVVWDNPVPVVVAFVQLEGKLLLARNAKWPPGIQSVISGYLEKGETPEQAVIRELSEETALRPKRVDFLGLYISYELNQLLLAYVIDAEGTVQLSDELVDYTLFQADELTPQIFGCSPRVKDWLKMPLGLGPAIKKYLQVFHNIE